MALTDKQKALVTTILADERFCRYPPSVIEFIVQFDANFGSDWIKERERKQRRESRGSKSIQTPKDPAEVPPVLETVEYSLVVHAAPELKKQVSAKDNDGDQEA